MRIKMINPLARIPAYATDGSSGLDLAALEDKLLHPGVCVRLSLGFALEIPAGFEGQVRPRSGLTMRGIDVMLGTIDSDYRGEIGAVLINHGTFPVHVRAGDRIAQLIIAPVQRVELIVVDTLSETVRGGAGFGSTGR